MVTYHYSNVDGLEVFYREAGRETPSLIMGTSSGEGPSGSTLKPGATVRRANNCKVNARLSQVLAHDRFDRVQRVFPLTQHKLLSPEKTVGQTTDLPDALDRPVVDYAFHHQGIVSINPVGQLALAGWELLGVGDWALGSKLCHVTVKPGWIRLECSIVNPPLFVDEFFQDVVPD